MFIKEGYRHSDGQFTGFFSMRVHEVAEIHHIYNTVKPFINCDGKFSYQPNSTKLGVVGVDRS